MRDGSMMTLRIFTPGPFFQADNAHRNTATPPALNAQERDVCLVLSRQKPGICGVGLRTLFPS